MRLSTLWDRKRMRHEGFDTMGFPAKRPTPLFMQQRLSQGGERFQNHYPYPQQNPKPIQEQSPLGLQLKKTPSFLDLIQKKLAQEKALEAEELRMRTKKENLFKASNLAATQLRIGSWEYKTKNAGRGLIVKFYFAKQKLLWEVLHSGFKYKMEIQWSDITAIKGKFPDDEPGTLSLVLGRPPAFFKEADPEPKKHTLWHKSSDFTGGQASTYRQHFLEFPPGVLDKHYKRLVQCDSRLGLLSQLPEPILGTPYFLTIAANPRQLKDGLVNLPDAYNLHDIAPISTPQGSPSNFEPLASLGITDDSSYCTQSPLSDTLTSFDHGIPRLEPVTESPISSLHDVVLLSPKNIFGPAAGTPNSGVLNGTPQSTFSNGVSHQGCSGCEVSLDDLLNVEPQVSFSIPHQDLSKATHHPFSGIGTCATEVNTNSEAQIFDSLEGPNLQPSLSIDDYVDQLDLEELHQALLIDTTTEPDENFLMPRVDSLISFLQSDQNSENNPINRLVSSEGIQDGNVLEPVIAHGLMPEYNAVAQEKNLNHSKGVLDENFLMSKVDSLSSFLQYAENNPLDKAEGVQDGKVLESVTAYGSTLDVVAQENNLNNSEGVQDENFLMSKVDSLSNFLLYDENNPLDRLVNSEGVQGGKVLEPVTAYGSTHDVVAEEKYLNDSEGVLVENFLMSKIDSFSNFLQLDQNSENNHTGRLVNLEGNQDGKVLEPATAYGSTLDVVAQENNLNGSTDFMQQRTMPRNDSCIELLHDLPRIASLPHICSYGDFRY